jgi:regulator of sirC expression with transglutaminase-like and TPR domain
MKSTKLFFLFTFCLLIITSNGTAQNRSFPTIWELPNIRESELNLTIWSLVIANEFDSSVDIPARLQQIQEMTMEIRRMLAGRNKDMDLFLATRSFLYESGSWNQNQPFAYDLDDPTGNILENRLISTYLDTRKGNCVSMPLLMAVLLENLDPTMEVHAVKAPLHLFLRIKDRQKGDVWNVETTNGANPARNSWYIEQSGITQTAIDSGLYMKNLSKKEFIAELLGTRISYHRKRAEYEQALKYTNLLLEVAPISDVGLVQKGSLSDWLAEGLRQKRIAQDNYLDEIDHATLQKLQFQSQQTMMKVFGMGWKPETPAQREEYLKTIDKQKNNTDTSQ